MSPTMPDQPSIFDGPYVTEDDDTRLKTQLGRVFALMRDGKPRTLHEIHSAAGGSAAGISARLRDLRKSKFGGFEIITENHGAGRFTYQLVDGHRPLRRTAADGTQKGMPKFDHTARKFIETLFNYTDHDDRCPPDPSQPCTCGLERLQILAGDAGCWS